MATSDPYAVLGVARSATNAEITRAYRRLLRTHHPDLRSGGDAPTHTTAELQRVLQAYAVLRDPVRRAAHDRATRRMNGLRATRPGPPPLWAGPVRWHAVR
ncbi:J domain-containing protein [Mycobacterium sp. M1]|uniref:J domain-containing protein n=1 Tax=Mycolicibacter acidiphilus TaxID=2835306 RepID=A0ABS5RH66_9MYCO|nr:J domain-containing protein [Mycolicibacter acidiphilus]